MQSGCYIFFVDLLKDRRRVAELVSYANRRDSVVKDAFSLAKDEFRSRESAHGHAGVFRCGQPWRPCPKDTRSELVANFRGSRLSHFEGCSLTTSHSTTWSGPPTRPKYAISDNIHQQLAKCFATRRSARSIMPFLRNSADENIHCWALVMMG